MESKKKKAPARKQEILDMIAAGKYEEAEKAIEELEEGHEDRIELEEAYLAKVAGSLENKKVAEPRKKTNAKVDVEFKKGAFMDALKKGHPEKAQEILADIPDDAEGREVLSKALAEYLQEAADKKNVAVKKVAAEKKKRTKPATEETINKAYDVLITELAKYETQRRAKHQHANFFARHRQQVAHMRDNFNKFVR